jgi:membrane associated rhomboid family serine protease
VQFTHLREPGGAALREHFPWATLALVAATCCAFALELLHPGGLRGAIEQWGEVPRRIAAGLDIPGTGIPAWVAMLTYIFLHASLSHLVGNMVALALIGASVERRAGSRRLLLLYFSSGMLASVIAVFTQWHSEHALCGASGAVAGVALAWLLLLPGSWRSGWLGPAGGWRGAIAWLETVSRTGIALWVLGCWVLWPLAVAASGAGWRVLAFRTNLTHLSGALVGLVLVLPYAAQQWHTAWRQRKAAGWHGTLMA